MLLTKKVILEWNRSNRKYYEGKGFLFTNYNDSFEMGIEDLKEISVCRVEIRCDYCGEITNKEYRAYNKQREIIQKDCCSSRKCMVAKTKEVNLVTIGVESVNQLEEKKNNARLKFQTPIEEVIKLAENKGLTVIDYSNYENGKSRLKVICNNHSEYGVHETNASNIKSQTYCCKVGGSEATGLARRLDGEKVVGAFIEKGLIPLFKAEDYTINSEPLPFKCPKHPNEVQYRQFSNLPYSEGCILCAKERTGNALRLNQEDVFSYFKARNLIVEDNETYKDKDTHIACRCIFHPDEIQYKTYHALKNTDEPCIYCRNEKSITELNRTLRSTIADWRRKSEKECGYRCILTSSSNYEVHHTYSFNKTIKDVLEYLSIDITDYNSKDIINTKKEVIKRHESLKGVCIHPSLHILFHQIYGKENNTEKQFKEFSIRYKNGEFDEILNNNIKESIAN